MTTITELLARIDRSYDELPRVGGARIEHIGGFELFLRGDSGWPYYARPRPRATTAEPTDVAEVRARLRDVGAPEAFEWVHEVSPDVLRSVEASGLEVLLAPLMVLDPRRLPTASPTGAQIAVLDPNGPDFPDLLAVSFAVAKIGFGAEGTAAGPAGAAERDAAVVPVDPDLVAFVAAGIRAGHKAEAIATTPPLGVVARGALQSALGAAEIVGVATLPAARRGGLGAAISAALARHALSQGNDIVFLSAASESVARVYARIGFDRVGTACIASLPGAST